LIHLKLVKEDRHVPPSCGRKLWDERYSWSLYRVYLIEELNRDRFEAFRNFLNNFLPKTFKFNNQTATFVIDRTYEHYSNCFALITEEEDKNRIEGNALKPHSITFRNRWEKGTEIQLSRNIELNKLVVNELLRQFLGEELEWEQLDVPPQPTIEELAETRREQQLRRLKEKLEPIDYQILELRKKGASLWAIVGKTGLSYGTVLYRLRRIHQIPELVEQLPIQFRLLTREERQKLNKKGTG